MQLAYLQVLSCLKSWTHYISYWCTTIALPIVHQLISLHYKNEKWVYFFIITMTSEVMLCLWYCSSLGYTSLTAVQITGLYFFCDIRIYWIVLHYYDNPYNDKWKKKSRRNDNLLIFNGHFLPFGMQPTIFNWLESFNQTTFNLLNNIGCTVVYLCGQDKLHRMGSWFWICTLWSLQEANNTSMVNNPTRMDVQNWWWPCWNCICKMESGQPSHPYYIWFSPAFNCVVSAEHCMCPHAVA